MMSLNLDLATIADLDAGAAGVVINREIQKALADLEDRGEDGAARTVDIKISLKLDGNAVKVVAEAKANLPKYRTGPTFGKLKRKGNTVGMAFVPDSPQNPDQMTMTDAEDRG